MQPVDRAGIVVSAMSESDGGLIQAVLLLADRTNIARSAP
jgi:hypothetical protein